MKLLLGSCVWGGTKAELQALGHDVVWCGDWESVVDAATHEHFALKGDPVAYFDSEQFSGKLDNPEFAKRKEFSWQREYRLVLHRGVEEPATNRREMMRDK